jgi:hypothetical protein
VKCSTKLGKYEKTKKVGFSVRRWSGTKLDLREMICLIRWTLALFTWTISSQLPARQRDARRVERAHVMHEKIEKLRRYHDCHLSSCNLISFESMKKSTDAPVRLMQISAPISPPLATGQSNPYRDIGVGRPPPGRGRKTSNQRLRQEQHAVCGLFSVSCVYWKRKRAWRARQEGRRCLVSARLPLLGHTV